MKKSICLFVASISLIFTGTVLAASLGEAADSISFTAELVGHAMWAACIIVGIILLASSFSQYQIHRMNPKAVPLVTPITYLVLALLSLSIPFLHYLTGMNEKESLESKSQNPAYHKIDERVPSFYDIDE